jgi:hypothetical protein
MLDLQADLAFGSATSHEITSQRHLGLISFVSRCQNENHDDQFTMSSASSSQCPVCFKSSYDSSSTCCRWCRDGILIPPTPTSKNLTTQGYTACSVCKTQISNPSSTHNLCATCVDALAEDERVTTYESAGTPSGDVITVTQESSAESLSLDDATYNLGPVSARRSLNFDHDDRKQMLRLQIPHSLVKDQLIEACQSGSTIELTLTPAATSSSISMEAIVLNVESIQETTVSSMAPATSCPSTPASTKKLCFVCQTKPIEDWMTRCVPCHAAWQREVNPSKGPGVCKSCSSATDHEWQKYCNKCFPDAKISRGLGVCRTCNGATEHSYYKYCNKCYPATQSGNDRLASKRKLSDTVSPCNRSQVSCKCVSCGGQCEQSWMTHCVKCYPQSKRATLSNAS